MTPWQIALGQLAAKPYVETKYCETCKKEHPLSEFQFSSKGYPQRACRASKKTMHAPRVCKVAACQATFVPTLVHQVTCCKQCSTVWESESRKIAQIKRRGMVSA